MAWVRGRNIYYFLSDQKNESLGLCTTTIFDPNFKTTISQNYGGSSLDKISVIASTCSPVNVSTNWGYTSVNTAASATISSVSPLTVETFRWIGTVGRTSEWKCISPLAATIATQIILSSHPRPVVSVSSTTQS